MKSTKMIFIAAFTFLTSLSAFGQDTQTTDQSALTPEQMQSAFSPQSTPLPLITLTESEMQQTKGASHFILIDINGSVYKIPLPD